MLFEVYINYVFVDQDGGAVKMSVNDLAIVICYQRSLCHDNFVKTPPNVQPIYYAVLTQMWLLSFPEMLLPEKLEKIIGCSMSRV